MDLDALISRFAVALGIGLLIGLERGWRTREAEPGSRTAGIRTFAMSSVLGAVIGAAAQRFEAAAGGVLLGLAFAAYAAVFATFSRDENRHAGTFSATTAVAGMIAFSLGAYAVIGDLRVAAAVAVATTALLALRENLHGLVERITWPELRSALVLLAMTFIALPIVPDESIGPFGGVNPRQVWTIAIVLAGVSFLGYGAVKHFGVSRGVLLAAAAGGLVSSTAVTAANARRAAAGEGSPRLLAAGVALATAISFARVVVIVAVINPTLLALTAPPLFAAAIVAAAYALISVYWRAPDGGEHQAVEFRNPFGFWSVVGFALLLGGVILIGRFLGETLGTTGAVIGAAAMGLADVDAVTVSMARLAPQPLDAASAAYAILAAVISNALSKLAIGAVIGRGAFAVEITAMSLATMIAAAVALWLALVLLPAG
jgi:uncharacterized membrane protein (DUF4010 family)